MISGRSPILPGRLGSPDMVLRDDPRADPRLVAAMAAVGLDGEQPAAGVDADASLEALLAYCDVAEPGFEALFRALAIDLPPVEAVTASVEVIRGIDGNDVTLFIHRPTAVTGPLPGVLHLHGGGMVIMEAAGPGSTLIVSGESGGGNLTLATTLNAKRDGRLAQIDGVYAQCPYISNAYANPVPELASLVENDGYFLSCEMMSLLAKVYDPPTSTPRTRSRGPTTPPRTTSWALHPMSSP